MLEDSVNCQPQGGFHCELHGNEISYGLAQGISAPVIDKNGIVTANVRNILTFSRLGE